MEPNSDSKNSKPPRGGMKWLVKATNAVDAAYLIGIFGLPLVLWLIWRFFG